MKDFITTYLFCSLLPCLVFAQFPHSGIQTPQLPTFSTPEPIQMGVATPNMRPTSAQNDPLYQQQRQRAQQDMDAYRKRQEHLKVIRQEAHQALADYEPTASAYPAIRYNLPSSPRVAATEKFQNALQKVNTMLEGKAPLSLKRAVFLTENAYFDNQMDYESYAQTLDNMVRHCQLALEQSGLDVTNLLAKLMILHKFMADTLTVQATSRERSVTTYPMKYDFEDFRGEKDVTKQMVSKLMHTTTGQCHSMPLLFLILAEEMDVEAHLALAPDHSYVKFQDEMGNWYNLELTNGLITSDQFIMQSGYIKAEAIQNKLYMRPLSRRETVAQCLNDLGIYYTHRFGVDQFSEEIMHSLEEHVPDALHTSIWQASYYSDQFQFVLKQYYERQAPQSVVDADEKAMAILQTRNRYYKKIDNLGHEFMPAEVYQKWLNSLNEAAQQQKARQSLLKINEMLVK